MATANPEFRFIEEPRGYWVGGNRLLSVTEIIKDNGFSNLEWTTQTALIRGRIVHSITAGLDRRLSATHQQEEEKKKIIKKHAISPVFFFSPAFFLCKKKQKNG